MKTQSIKTAVMSVLAMLATADMAFAQETTVPVVDKGDTAFMMLASVLVLFMTVPGLALFYGGLVRTKNMLSVLMQCTMITAVVIVAWVFYGYSFAFGGSASPWWGGTAKLFLAGVNLQTTSATFTSGVVIPEYVFVVFQMTFACIAPALVIGAFVERIKFSAVMAFVLIWVTFAYLPIAHMVWDANGYLYGLGALDFAGGTVVHINAGIAALVAAIAVGRREGLGRDLMAPHSMSLTMVGASMLWVGWFGFNAGSNLEANAGATLAMINTFTATAGAIIAWAVIESVLRGKASMLGAASGLVAGLVAITPAAGTVGPVGAIALGAIASGICYLFVAVVKNRFGYDDSLDVFGIHGIGGIVGAIGTAPFSAAALGGVKGDEYSIASQTIIQLQAVSLTIGWSAVISAVALYAIKAVIGLRVPSDAERQGLDLASHGEAAYHS